MAMPTRAALTDRSGAVHRLDRPVSTSAYAPHTVDRTIETT